MVLDALSFFSTIPAFPSVLLYDRCKSGVFFARSRFRDGVQTAVVIIDDLTCVLNQMISYIILFIFVDFNLF